MSTHAQIRTLSGLKSARESEADRVSHARLERIHWLHRQFYEARIWRLVFFVLLVGHSGLLAAEGPGAWWLATILSAAVAGGVWVRLWWERGGRDG